MRVSDYMSKSPVTVKSSADYNVAFDIMDSGSMHHLPAEISDVMHTPVVSIAPDAPLSLAVKQMMKDHIGCLPVMEDGKHVIGILTETDLFRALTDVLDEKG